MYRVAVSNGNPVPCRRQVFHAIPHAKIFGTAIFYAVSPAATHRGVVQRST